MHTHIKRTIIQLFGRLIFLISVDGAMMDDGRIVPQLSVEELASLFGYLSEDATGNRVILPDSERPTD